jgi:hypothetical protein
MDTKVLAGESEDRRPLRKPRHRFKYNIKKKLKEAGVRKSRRFNWLRMGPVSNSSLYDNERTGSTKGKDSWATISLSRMLLHIESTSY